MSRLILFAFNLASLLFNINKLKIDFCIKKTDVFLMGTCVVLVEIFLMWNSKGSIVLMFPLMMSSGLKLLTEWIELLDGKGYFYSNKDFSKSLGIKELKVFN